MKWTVRSSAKKSVGVELTNFHMRVSTYMGKDAQLLTDELMWKSFDGSEFNVDDWEAQQLDFLSNFVKSHRLQGTQAVLSVPNDKVVVRYMQLPNLPVKQMKQAVSVEMGSTIHLPFDNPIYEVYPVPSINQRELQDGLVSVCLIAIPGEEIERAKGLAVMAGLRPVAVDLSTLAILRASGMEPKESDALTCLVYVDHGSVNMSIFVGPNLYFLRTVERSDAEAGERLAQEIAHELERVVNFFNYNLSDVERSLERILVHSSFGTSRELADGLATRLGRNVLTLDMQDGLIADARYQVAAGLALKGRV